MTNKDIFIGGHIFDANLSKVEFVYDARQFNKEITPIENGEILISEEKLSGRKYFLRVNDILYGQNPNWSKEVARGYNYEKKNSDISDEHETPSNTYTLERDDQLFLVAKCEILGVHNTKDFVSARQVPAYFSSVRKLTEDDLSSYLGGFTGDLKFGNIRSGSQHLNFEGGIFKEILSKHIGVFAKTGGGKSNTIKTLLGVMMDTEGEVSTLILEPHGEYIADLKRHPLAKDRLLIYNQSGKNNERKIRLSYTRITIESLLSIKKQMNWSEPQVRLLYEAQAVLGKNWFKKLCELPVEALDLDIPNNSDDEDEEDENENSENFFDNIPMPNSRDNSKAAQQGFLRQYLPSTNVETLKALKSKLRRIYNFTFLVDGEIHDDMDTIFSSLENGKSVLIDMAQLSKLEELFLSSVLAGETLRRRKKQYINNRDDFTFNKVTPIVIVMEEAQRVLGRNEDSDSNIFPQIVNEGRKFMVGLIAITQQPKIMDPIILSQFNTLIILGISDETDFDILKGCSQNALQQLKLEIKQLMPGEALISSPKFPFAMPLKIFLYDDYLKNHKGRSKNSLSPDKNSFSDFQ
jgi:DNA helicase HerA-like ATPase